MKKCSNCKEEKPLTEFGKRSYNKDGLMECCKTCQKERAAMHDKKRKEEKWDAAFIF